MHAARLDHSPRLKRVLDLLSDGAEHSTLDVISGAQVCAVSAAVAELRDNGFKVRCTRRGDLFFYRLERGEL